jgi:hypothetical protein
VDSNAFARSQPENAKRPVDFRRVYATLLTNSLGLPDRATHRLSTVGIFRGGRAGPAGYHEPVLCQGAILVFS